MKRSPIVSLSMIVKNEEKYLRQCLESVKGIADEIVIVDTGSTDRTLEIAGEFNARVYHFTWIGDFSAARNFALGKSGGKWILYLDADERLTKASVKEIKKLTGNPRAPKLGIRCLVNSIDDKFGKPKLMKYTRLFMNSPGIAFSGKVHEQIDDSLKDNGYLIDDSSVEIIHIGYNIDREGLQKKAGRNLELLLKEFALNSSGYYAFQLGNTYEILGDQENSVRYFLAALKDERLNSSYRSICHLQIGSYYESVLHDYKKALQETLAGLESDPNNPMLNLLASQIYFRLGQKDKAIASCMDALRNNKKVNARHCQSSSILEVILKDEKIISHGLYTAYQFGESAAFDYFLKECSQGFKQTCTDLLNNRPLSENEIKKFRQLINSDNIYLFLLMLERYAHKTVALKIMLSVKDKFIDNARFLSVLGNMYLASLEIEEAIEMLEGSLKLKEKDPAAIFSLIAALIRKNNFEKIPGLLLTAQKEFGHIDLFMEKFEILKEKLQGITR